METKDFKGEALVVFHPNKLTGTRDAGDPVYEAHFGPLGAFEA